MNIHCRRITTKPTLWERIDRNPALGALVVFAIFFAIIGAAEVLCMFLGAAFDIRIG